MIFLGPSVGGTWDGDGTFRPLLAKESGLHIYGEQRGAALCDFDKDGRLDLVVTQNAAETKLYKNSHGTPGLRIRLRGPEGNPWGVGAIVRLLGEKAVSPSVEMHAGSGYWSQDSPVLVMRHLAGAFRIQVRWPGGRLVTAAVPPEAAEIEVDLGGRGRTVAKR